MTGRELCKSHLAAPLSCKTVRRVHRFPLKQEARRRFSSLRKTLLRRPSPEFAAAVARRSVMHRRKTASHADASPYPPGRNRHGDPGDQRHHKCECDIPLNEPPKAQCKGEQAKASEGGANRIDPSRLLAASFSLQAGLVLAADLVAFNQRSAGAKNCRKRQKQAAD